MNKVIANILTIILIIIILIPEIIRKKEKGAIDIFTGVNFVYLLCFGFIQMIFINYDIRPTLNTITPNLASIDFERDNYWVASLMSLIGYICIFVGYNWASLGRKYIIKNNYTYKVKYYLIRNLAYITLFIGGFAILKYIIMLGGILKPILYAQDLRYNAILERGGYIRILQPLIILSNIAFFVLYDHYKKRKYLLLTIITYILSIYYLFTYAGRLPLFLFIVTIPLYIIEKKKNLNFRKLCIMATIGTIILVFGEYVFDYLTGVQNLSSFDVNTTIKRIVVQFSFPYVNLLKVSDFVQNGGYRYFIDMVTWIINMFPSGLLSLIGMHEIVPSYQMNTMNFLSQNSGGVPVDILTLGYYQFNVVGVIILTFVFGRIVRYFRDLTYEANDEMLTMLKVRMFIFMSMIVIYADIDVIFKRRMEYWIFAVIAVFACIKIKKKVD